MKQRAVFLDKDGTLVVDRPYNVNPGLMRLEDGVGEALSQLKQAGYQLIVVSNQSGVARGYFREDELRPVETRLREMIRSQAGIELDGFYYCPHHPNGSILDYARECDCRKPQPGMLLQAAADLRIDLSQSWMVGDILHDVEAGKRAGCRTVLVDNGHETEWQMDSTWRIADFTAATIAEAARVILSNNSLPGQLTGEEMERHG